MKVRDLMTTDLKVCTPDTTVAEAAHLLWQGDCGMLPVVDDGELAGVVTDRDMFIALGTRNARAAGLRVGAVSSRHVATCAPDDSIETALATMREARVHRLPVVGNDGTLRGVLSTNDLVRAAGADRGVAPDEVLRTLQEICGPKQLAPRGAAA